jgi:hypothetical protein
MMREGVEIQNEIFVVDPMVFCTLQFSECCIIVEAVAA